MKIHVNHMTINIAGDLSPEVKAYLEQVAKDELDRQFALLNEYERTTEALSQLGNDNDSVAQAMRLLGCSEKFIQDTFKPQS